MNKEFCIIPLDELHRYEIERYNGYERNEIFSGFNRQRSIKDGLIVFLTPKQHRTGKHSFHLAPKEWIWLKELAQQTWQEYYNKTKEDFIIEYGKSYL